jgi:hypothetical protein
VSVLVGGYLGRRRIGRLGRVGRGVDRLGVKAAEVVDGGVGQRVDLRVGLTVAATEEFLGDPSRVPWVLRDDLLRRDLLESDRQRLVGVDLLDERRRVLAEPFTE